MSFTFCLSNSTSQIVTQLRDPNKHGHGVCYSFHLHIIDRFLEVLDDFVWVLICLAYCVNRLMMIITIIDMAHDSIQMIDFENKLICRTIQLYRRKVYLLAKYRCIISVWTVSFFILLYAKYPILLFKLKVIWQASSLSWCGEPRK